MITIEYNDSAVIDRLNDLLKKCADLSPAMKEIGEDMVESTKRRFATTTAPDGTPWAANSAVTVARYLGALSGSSYKKDGTLSKKGEKFKGSKKPLTGETKILQATINYQLAGPNAVHIGSPQPYAAMQQFGGTKSEWPHLWGDIPARPFLGVSDLDRANILDIVGSYLVR